MVPKMLERKLKCEWKIPGWRTTEQTFLLGENVVCLRKGMSVSVSGPHGAGRGSKFLNFCKMGLCLPTDHWDTECK